MNNESILENKKCKTCGWSIVSVCCNDGMAEGEWGKWDWWLYCSNKSCVHHEGEGVYQNIPDWIDSSY